MSSPPALGDLLAADGYDSPFAGVNLESVWQDFVNRSASTDQEWFSVILADPALFLKALAAEKAAQDPCLSEAEDRAYKQLELLGNVALVLCVTEIGDGS